MLMLTRPLEKWFSRLKLNRSFQITSKPAIKVGFGDSVIPYQPLRE
jgi:hypothetical protein